jgi:hypothetical protein
MTGSKGRVQAPSQALTGQAKVVQLDRHFGWAVRGGWGLCIRLWWVRSVHGEAASRGGAARGPKARKRKRGSAAAAASPRNESATAVEYFGWAGLVQRLALREKHQIRVRRDFRPLAVERTWMLAGALK